MPRYSAFLILLCSFLFCGFLFGAPNTLVAEGMPLDASVVRLTSTSQSPQTGTGFVIGIQSEAIYIVTARHVVEASNEIKVDFALNRSRSYTAEVLQHDRREDLALLRVMNAPRGVEPLRISSMEPVVGEFCTVMGFPHRSIVPRQNKVTLASREGTRLILSGNLEPGISGSPLIQDGDVIGMILAREGGYAEAIPGQILHLALDSWLPGLLPATSSRSVKHVEERQIPLFEMEIYEASQFEELYQFIRDHPGQLVEIRSGIRKPEPIYRPGREEEIEFFFPDVGECNIDPSFMGSIDSHCGGFHILFKDCDSLFQQEGRYKNFYIGNDLLLFDGFFLTDNRILFHQGVWIRLECVSRKEVLLGQRQ